MRNTGSHFYIAAVVAILLVAAGIRFADPFFVQATRLIAFDSYQLLNPAEYDPELPVRMVDIDDASLSRVGQWPWSRVTVAELLDKLVQQGAAVVVFDILFSEPDRTSPEEVMKLLSPEEAQAIAPIVQGRESHDAAFAAAIARSPTITATALNNGTSPAPPQKAGFAVAGDDPKPFVRAFTGATTNLPIFDQAATGIGSINWVPDRDQVVRRLPLVYRVGDQYIPTLVTEALRVAQGAGTYVLKSSNASGEEAFGQQTGLNHIRIGAIEVPTDQNGAIWLQFRRSNPEAYIPAWTVMAGENDPNQIAGTIVIVGTSAPGLMDLRATPLNPSISGAEIHVQALEHILRGTTITRPDYAVAVELAIMAIFGLLLAALLPRLSPLTSAVVGITAIAMVLVGGYVAYSAFGLLFDPSFPALVLFVLVSAITIYVYRRSELQKSEVRRAFGYYVSPAVVNEIVRNPDKLELGGEVRELSVLFCDVRNFTSISERMTAHELTRFINNLLTPLSEIILDNRGTIDKYIGDAIMAFWNAPLTDEHHAQNALASALAMIRRMETLNVEWRKQAEEAGQPYTEVNIGIGINSGNCCVGNLGSSLRFDYSAIGDDVNVASRLEGLSKVYGVPIVLGETTVSQLNGAHLIEMDLMRVKGRGQPLRIFTAFEAFGIGNGGNPDLAAKHAEMLKLYRGKDWDGAEAAISACQGFGIRGLDGLYAVYRSRIEEWRAEPPPADWDGAYTATSK